ncbi:MAG TPA: replicative DNA helicase [Nocardioides sp.]|nr:replicative DNA helicase [Nocardioides sp.]
MPPQDLAAEQSVLGAMLISKDAIADVVEVIRGVDYYRPAHEEIHEAILDLFGRGEPADMVTVAGELQRRGQLQKIGGAAYLHTLAANVPIAANAGFYAEIVYEKAILRRLVDAGTKIVQISYAGEGEIDGIVNEAQSEIYKVTDRNKSEDYAPLSDIMDSVLDEIEAIENREAGIYGVPTGFADFDELTNGLHSGQMIVVAARPAMGKSTLALDFCRAAAIHNNLTSAFFSLEMTRAEIVMRLLSAEARIPLNHIRNGKMGTEEWDRLARHVAKVSAAPMFIDDSPNMTMTEIRAKARRLKQKHDLRLMVIDYLQLMSSGKKVESRQLEVSEFSRQMKLLAKELEIPIIALSQLNRGPEQRADKRPAMSDLRESGCLTADTRLLRADTNAEISLGELMETGAKDVPVWALDDRLKLVPRTLTHAFPSGTKPVFEVTLASGRRVKATGNHPFLTYDGWMPLAELEVGSRVGSIRHVPPPLQITPRDPHEIVSLGHRIGAEKFVPDWVFSLPKDQVALFLRTLWATDGRVHVGRKPQEGTVYYATSSRRLADDVARLLLRFNVFTRITTNRKPGHGKGYHVHVSGAENQLRFLDDVGVSGGREDQANELADVLRTVTPGVGSDSVPGEVWDDVRTALVERPDVESEPMSVGAAMSRVMTRSPRRQRLFHVAAILGDNDLALTATNDVYWDSITSIERVGDEAVYDATVLGVHNFIAEGIALHNSIEQDADMVILLHRDDVYEKESTRPGEADLIVAKHRNGATRDIVVAFQGHYSRFVDMAH